MSIKIATHTVMGLGIFLKHEYSHLYYSILFIADPNSAVNVSHIDSASLSCVMLFFLDSSLAFCSLSKST